MILYRSLALKTNFTGREISRDVSQYYIRGIFDSSLGLSKNN